ncbi:MAG: cyanate transporter, partial [Burkholderiaceae bacterium]
MSSSHRSTPSVTTTALSTPARILLGASLMLIAFNLRTLFSCLSVLLPDLIRETSITSAGAGYLTTLP